MSKLFLQTVFCILIFLPSASAAVERVAYFADLSIEELMNISVSSVTRKSQSILDTPAAVFVLTQEDIRRSGAASVPDLLRLAPGFEVGQIRSNAWAISARGFNDLYANKLLVLIDGRSVYTHLFSGVEWHLQDILLEDIERIEIIRGPGGTLWGSNAVNGIINIITKNAVDTPGRLVTAGFGNEEKFFTGLRYGWKQNIDTDCRVYVKYFDKDGSAVQSNDKVRDDWRSVRGGFRADGFLNYSDSYTLQGDIYAGESDQPAAAMTFLETSPMHVANSTESFSGWNLLSRWTHEFSPDSDMTFQLYYNYSERELTITDRVPDKWELTTFEKVKTDTADADFQHRFQLTPAHEIIWGTGARFLKDQFVYDENSMNAIKTQKDDMWLFSAFVQDQIELAENRLWFTLGSKFEHNGYTGWEIQPSAKLLWKITDRQSVWFSSSRAIRTPSRYEHDVTSLVVAMLPPEKNTPDSLGFIASIKGNPNIGAENLLAFESGYRVHPTESLFIDIAGFYNRYKDLTSYALHSYRFSSETPGRNALVIVSEIQNGAEADAYGFEIAVNWDPFRWLKFRASYSGLNISSSETGKYDAEDKDQCDPSHQFVLRTMMDMPYDIEFDAAIRYVGEIPAYDIDAYIEADIRLGWRPTKNIELSIVGRNLLRSGHPEYIDTLQEQIRSEAERSVYGKLTWRF